MNTNTPIKGVNLHAADIAAKIIMPDHSIVSVALADLGFTGDVRVRGLWKKLDLGTFTTTFAQNIPLHGAGPYRISRAKKK